MSENIKEIDCKELQNKLNSGGLLIDVRETNEYKLESIYGSISVPLSTLEPNCLAKMCEGKEVVFQCKSGKRSMIAATQMFDNGITNIYSLKGGIEEWKNRNLPINKTTKQTMSMFRQVQIVAGSMALIGVILGFTVSSNFFYLSGFVGAGLLFAGITDTCAMATLLSQMPWNKN